MLKPGNTRSSKVRGMAWNRGTEGDEAPSFCLLHMGNGIAKVIVPLLPPHMLKSGSVLPVSPAVSAIARSHNASICSLSGVSAHCARVRVLIRSRMHGSMREGYQAHDAHDPGVKDVTALYLYRSGMAQS